MINYFKLKRLYIKTMTAFDPETMDEMRREVGDLGE